MATFGRSLGRESIPGAQPKSRKAISHFFVGLIELQKLFLDLKTTREAGFECHSDKLQENRSMTPLFFSITAKFD